MSAAVRSKQSRYMQWAKLCSQARFNLATSGVMNYPLSELPVAITDLEINGADSYGNEALIGRIARKFGVKPECVVTAGGTSMANHLAMAALLDPGDEVLIEEPAYDPLLNVAAYLGANIRRFRRRFENGFRIDPDELRKSITPATRLIVITNLHNPSSVLTDQKTMAAVGEIAAEAGAHVLVDEVYLELLFDDPVPSAFHLGDQFVVTSSLTKGYGLSGLRCGWILCNPELADRMWKLDDLYSATRPYPPDILATIAFDNLGKIAERARTLVSANRRMMHELIDGSSHLETVIPEHGTTVFPRLLRGNVEDFCDLLGSRYETSVVPGRFFEMPQHFRIGLGGAPEMTAQALSRLGRALEEYGAQVTADH